MQETEDQGYEFDPVFLLHQIPRFCTRFSPGFLSQIENISVMSAHIFFFFTALMKEERIGFLAGSVGVQPLRNCWKSLSLKY